MADRALYCHGHQGFMLSWVTDFILLRPSRLHTITADRSCHGYQGHILSWPLRASNRSGCQDFLLLQLSGCYTIMAIGALYIFILPRPSRLYTVMADRASYCHGHQVFILSWLSGIYVVMAVSASYCPGCQCCILSWLSGLYAVTAIRASYCYGYQGLILSWLLGLYTAMTISEWVSLVVVHVTRLPSC